MRASGSQNQTLFQFIRSLRIDNKLTWRTARDYGLVLIGALLQALAMRLFLVPGQMVSGGISGAAQIINFFTGWPIGMMVFIGNAPLFLLGWRYLGGARFALRTAVAVAASGRRQSRATAASASGTRGVSPAARSPRERSRRRTGWR